MDNDVFIIDPSSGILQTNRTLGQFADGYFNLVFRASNGPGDKKRGDFTTLKVGCLDDCLNHHLSDGQEKVTHLVYVEFPGRSEGRFFPHGGKIWLGLWAVAYGIPRLA